MENIDILRLLIRRRIDFLINPTIVIFCIRKNSTNHMGSIVVKYPNNKMVV